MNGDAQQIINKITEIATRQEERHEENKQDVKIIFSKLDSMEKRFNELPCSVHTEKFRIYDKHIEESPSIRDKVRDNEAFVKTAKWSLRIVYAALVSLIAKILFIR